MNNDTMIKTTANETAKQFVIELKRHNLLKDNRQTPFQKTETLLYNYRNFVSAVDDKEKQIAFYRENGLQERSPSITTFTGTGSMQEFLSEGEKVDEKVGSLESSIRTTKNFISVIDAALAVLKDDPYFEIINLKYFEGKGRDEIAEQLEVDVSTITRNRTRLIEQLQIRLFTDEVLMNIFC